MNLAQAFLIDVQHDNLTQEVGVKINGTSIGAPTPVSQVGQSGTVTIPHPGGLPSTGVFVFTATALNDDGSSPESDPFTVVAGVPSKPGIISIRPVTP